MAPVDITNEKLEVLTEADIFHPLKKSNMVICKKEPVKVKHLKKKCILPWTFILIQTDGSVYPCCFSKYLLGNLNEHSWQEIWNGEKSVKLREMFQNDILPGECVGQPCAVEKI